MALHRAHADVQCRRDALGALPHGQQVHDLALARSESRDAVGQLGVLRGRIAGLRIEPEGLTDALEQRLRRDGLPEEVDRAAFERRTEVHRYSEETLYPSLVRMTRFLRPSARSPAATCCLSSMSRSPSAKRVGSASCRSSTIAVGSVRPATRVPVSSSTRKVCPRYGLSLKSVTSPPGNSCSRY